MLKNKMLALGGLLRNKNEAAHSILDVTADLDDNTTSAYIDE